VESVTCPGCQKPIRVLDEVLGQTAKCPFCKCHFRAPVRTPEGFTEPVLIKRNPFAASRTFGPGAALLFTGLLGLFTNVIDLAKTYADPEGYARQTRDAFAGRFDEWTEFTVKWRPRAVWVIAGLSVLTAAGGLAMLRVRRHGLAMAGATAAYFSVNHCCCILGVPAGTWALFVLMNPEVRAQFHAPTPPAA
jgi:hypothetical protein